MEEERVAIVDFADELQVRKQTIFKVIKRLGIRPTQRREPTRGNQKVATINHVEATAIRDELTRVHAHKRKVIGVEPESAPDSYCVDEVGLFYLIWLEPDHDPGRFKVGFTTDLEGTPPQAPVLSAIRQVREDLGLSENVGEGGH